SRHAAVASFLVAGVIGGPFAGGQQRAQRGTRSSVLNHAAAGARREKFLRQTQQGPEPVEHMRFQFGAGRAGGPQHALYAKSGRKKIAKNSRAGGVAREVCEKIRGLPVRDSRQNQVLDVLEYLLEGLAACRRVHRGK